MGRGRKSRRNQRQAGTEATSIKAQPTVFPTAIYVRLSVENLGREDRGAIENQKDVCREFVSECPDLQLVRIYEDNGWTGTVMHRPAFDELMDDIKNGIIKAVVVRDLSRFARNYIEAGTYLEQIFPDLGVRFISVKERLDTLAVGDATESLIVPLSLRPMSWAYMSRSNKKPPRYGICTMSSGGFLVCILSALPRKTMANSKL